MTQQLDPKQVRGLKEELDTLDSLAKIKTIGANLNLSEDGELSATGGGGGGGGVNLYSVLGQNIDGALTQKASTDLLVHTKPDGANDLITNNKINLGYLPDSILGQVVYGGGFVPTTAVATLTTNAQDKLGTTAETITLTNDTTDITGYEANEGIYYIATANGTFANISFETGDWLISLGTKWDKVDNTDAVTGVKGNAESTYRLGNVNITAANVGAIADTTSSVATSNIADNAVTTAKILDANVTTAKIADSNVTTDKINSSAVTTAKIADEAVTTAKIDDGAVTNAKIATGAVKAANIDFTTMKKWVPDYANRGSTNLLTGSGSTHSFTIQENGFITYSLKIYGVQNHAQIYINSKIIIDEEAVTSSAYGPNGVLPVSIGDEIYCVYSTDTGGNFVYFIPGKWV